MFSFVNFLHFYGYYFYFYFLSGTTIDIRLKAGTMKGANKKPKTKNAIGLEKYRLQRFEHMDNYLKKKKMIYQLIPTQDADNVLNKSLTIDEDYIINCLEIQKIKDIFNVTEKIDGKFIVDVSLLKEF